MTGQDDLATILETGVVAIVRLDSGEQLVRVADAVRAGGVRAIEFTMTTPGALAALEMATRELGQDVVFGAGTVLDAETARAAVLAGARFIVAPTLRRETLETCRRYGVLAIPGAFTPTEILTAWEWGADLVKVFPATALGPQYLRDVLAPLPQVRLVPTGGVGLENVRDFFRAGAVAVGVSSHLVDRQTVADGAWARLTDRARALVAAVAEARRG